MNAFYAEAVERQMAWLKWSIRDGQRQWDSLGFGSTMHNYRAVLASADTFFMDRHFSSMVDLARKSVPDTLTFDPVWVQAPAGFLWLEEPFRIPTVHGDLQRIRTMVPPDPGVRVVGTIDHRQDPNLSVRALGWIKVPAGKGLERKDGSIRYVSKGDSYLFVTYQALNDYHPGAPGFGCWTHFTLAPGDDLKGRIGYFESEFTEEEQGRYRGAGAQELHEIRWVYTAMYLMAQRLTTVIPERTPRAVRRRAEKAKEHVPDVIRVVTLRRYQEHRKAEAHKTVDWQWRWMVGGHWRAQPYKDGTVKDIWIDTYTKGPEGKPFKDPGHKLFAARR